MILTIFLVTTMRLLEDVYNYTNMRLSLKSQTLKYTELTEINIYFTTKLMGVVYITEYYNTQRNYRNKCSISTSCNLFTKH